MLEVFYYKTALRGDLLEDGASVGIHLALIYNSTRGALVQVEEYP